MSGLRHRMTSRQLVDWHGPRGRTGVPYSVADGARLTCRPRADANMCSTLVVCVLLPRFELAVAAGGREALARGPARARARAGPRAADRRGLGGRRGLRRAGRPAAGGGARALPDAAPGRARPGRRGRRVGPRRSAPSRASARRSSPSRPGVAWFEARGPAQPPRRRVEGVLAATRRALARARRGSAPRPRASPRWPPPARARAAPAGDRRPTGAGARWPPISRRCRSRCSASRPETAALPEPLERFGIRTLGRARRAAARRARRPLRRRRAARARPRPRARHAAAPAAAGRAAGGGARAAGVGLRARSSSARSAC